MIPPEAPMRERNPMRSPTMLAPGWERYGLTHWPGLGAYCWTDWGRCQFGGLGRGREPMDHVRLRQLGAACYVRIKGARP